MINGTGFFIAVHDVGGRFRERVYSDRVMFLASDDN